MNDDSTNDVSMNSGPVNDGWDFEHRPRRLRITVIALAVLIMLAHIVWAVILVRGDTGVTFSVADQLAFVVIGIVLAGAVLTLLRVRVRAGAPGVEIRGPWRVRVWSWDHVVGLTFPRSSYWPRLELPAYEHIGIWAIQSVDGPDAAEAMRRLREVIREYKPSAADPETVADR